MKKQILKMMIVILISVGLLLTLSGCTKKEPVTDGKFRVVTSFYPMYIMTLNITAGANNIEVLALTQSNTGCIHDYTLATADLKKLESANVLIENGLGLESFNDKIKQTYQDISFIDSSNRIDNVIKEEETINPHIWTSIDNYIKQVNTIAEELAKENPENKVVYEENAKAYIKKLNDLKTEYQEKIIKLNGMGVVVLNESFSYLARDLGLKAITLQTDHEQSTLSGEVLNTTINQMKSRQIKAIIIDKEDPTKNAELLVRETGATIYQLDSCINGSLSKDSYLNAMRGNFEKILEMAK